MKRIFSLFILLVSALTFASDWELELNEDGIKVYTRTSMIKIENEEEEALEFKVTGSIKNRDFDRIIKEINNVSNHTAIYGCETAKKISDDVNYYYFDNPWPVADSDIVRTITTEKSEDGNNVVLKHMSTPDKYKKESVKRLDVSDIIYNLNKEGEKVKIEIEGKFVPKGIPLMLAKGWFPDGPADMFKTILKLTGK